MYFIKKQRTKLLYKKLLPLKKNIQNKDKLMKFKKKKWQNLQRLILKFRKQKFYDPTSQFLSNFKNFFNKKFKHNLQNKQRLSFYYGALRKTYLRKIVRATLNGFKKRNIHAIRMKICIKCVIYGMQDILIIRFIPTIRKKFGIS